MLKCLVYTLLWKSACLSVCGYVFMYNSEQCLIKVTDRCLLINNSRVTFCCCITIIIGFCIIISIWKFIMNLEYFPRQLSLSCLGGLIFLEFFTSNLEVNVTPAEFLPRFALAYCRATIHRYQDRSKVRARKPLQCTSKSVLSPGFLTHPGCFEEKYQLRPTSHSTGLGITQQYCRMLICFANFDVEVVR